MHSNLSISFHCILYVVIRSIRLEYVSIPHGAPSPSIDGAGVVFKMRPMSILNVIRLYRWSISRVLNTRVVLPT